MAIPAPILSGSPAKVNESEMAKWKVSPEGQCDSKYLRPSSVVLMIVSLTASYCCRTTELSDNGRSIASELASDVARALQPIGIVIVSPIHSLVLAWPTPRAALAPCEVPTLDRQTNQSRAPTNRPTRADCTELQSA